ncbi:MAG TPA: hypothetical protein DCM15_05065, partial [Cryomorphaceae bacterium]|nr:hypothetical protein [Cryomorphaceae bacterium]
MKKIFALLGFLLTSILLPGQNLLLSSPLEIPLVLSGTFAELRSNHFHGGIDIKTQGRSGLKVRAVAAGYVSRISISPYGYGNALYIKHPEGYTSVYGHLNGFSTEIERWVEEQLRDRSKNNGNLYPSKESFVVQREDFIAFSGNTGGSMGPHLHFEIRDSRTEEPLNPLEFGLTVLDSRPPSLRGLMWVTQDFTDRGNFKDGDTLDLRALNIGVPIGINLYTTDKQDGANNNNGVYKILSSVNNDAVFSAEYRRINFSTSRFINAHFDYQQYYASGARWTRLYELDNNPLKISSTEETIFPEFRSSKGWITVAKDSLVNVTILVTDHAGNKSNTSFYILGSPMDSTFRTGLSWDQMHTLKEDKIRVSIPSGAMYRNTNFKLVKKGQGKYLIGGGDVPLQKSIEVTWKLDSIQKGGFGWFAWVEAESRKQRAEIAKRTGDVLTFSTRNT